MCTHPFTLTFTIIGYSDENNQLKIRDNRSRDDEGASAATLRVSVLLKDVTGSQVVCKVKPRTFISP